MKRRIGLLLLASFLILHIFVLGRAGDARKAMPSGAVVPLVLPSPVLRIASFEFKGFVSDILFIRALVFEGGTYERKEKPRIKPEEWDWINQILNASADSDPYFFDPYFFANAHMTWEGGMINETNALLEKGTRHRDRDWMLPFFIGFNHFYFLHDNNRAAEYLMTASLRPGPSEQLASLAARLAYKERQTENAILFLETILKKTGDERLRKEYKTRLEALQARLILERAVSDYKHKYGIIPPSLENLVGKGLMKEIPRDPYDGKFSINPSGEINSTSDYMLMPRQRTSGPPF